MIQHLVELQAENMKNTSRKELTLGLKQVN